MTRASFFAILLACGLSLFVHPLALAQNKPMKIEQATFGKTSEGVEVKIYTLKNANGVVLKLIDYGAAIQSLKVPDKNGKSLEMQLGYNTLEEYLKYGSHFGGAVGRFANRIAGGKFTLDGKEYTLAKNNGPNHLHGGPTGFGKRVWKSRIVENPRGEAGVQFSYHSKDGEEGYPGNMDVSITYTLNDKNELTMSYEAKTDKMTVVNLTNHAYWNLAGADSGEVLDHTLMINADKVLDVDNTLIPTGKSNSVKGTPLDFTQLKPIGRDIAEVKKFRPANGYDHCYVLNKRPTRDFAPQLAARATSPKSGITMEVSTTEPGVQLYTANHLSGKPADAGAPQHGAFCLETQHYPDSPNQPDFPTTTLKPGEIYRQITVHKFNVQK
ncbi:MAG: aldose epimerase family protein [Pirellulales bacterium]